MKSKLVAYIERDVESGIYVAIVPGIPGAHTQAKTLDELQTKLKEILSFVWKRWIRMKKRTCQNLLESSKLR